MLYICRNHLKHIIMKEALANRLVNYTLDNQNLIR
jgi:hypothetical protein